MSATVSKDHDVAFGGGSLRSEAAQTLFNGIKASSTELQLNEFMKLVIRAGVEERIGEDEYAFLANCIDTRRHKTSPKGLSSLGVISTQVARRSATKRRQRSPDRQKSRDRRRTLGGSSALPPALRAHYTEGLRAVLCVVCEEIKRRGFCDFPIDKIAAIAGVCRTTAQNALREAAWQGHMSVAVRKRPGRKNLTNIVRITSPEWLTWISRGVSKLGQIGLKIAKMVSPTGKEDSLEDKGARTYAQGAHANSKSSQSRKRWPDSWAGPARNLFVST
ncbi:MAG: hypothetical protein P4L57_00955 [Rhizomicrobium sp.]|nr:hypothetical protein [Rhizomicrobium sp.]